MNQEQFNKLPKWAQKEFKTLKRERDDAVRDLSEASNHQTVSNIYVNDYTNNTKWYVQGREIVVEAYGIELSIFIPRPDDGQRLQGIELSYTAPGRWGTDCIGITPASHGRVYLINHAAYPNISQNEQEAINKIVDKSQLHPTVKANQ